MQLYGHLSPISRIVQVRQMIRWALQVEQEQNQEWSSSVGPDILTPKCWPTIKDLDSILMAGTVEYGDCTSAEGLDLPHQEGYLLDIGSCS